MASGRDLATLLVNSKCCDHFYEMNKASALSQYFEIRKDKLRWNGSLDNLKSFVSTEFNEGTSSWKSPGGGTWVSKSENLSVTWHSKSKTVYLTGGRSEECYDYIHNAIKANLSEINRQSPNNVCAELDVEVNMAENTTLVLNQYNNEVNERKGFKCDECRKLSLDMSEAQLAIALIWSILLKRNRHVMRSSKASKHLAFVQKLNLYVANYCRLIYVIATLMIHSHSVETNLLN